MIAASRATDRHPINPALDLSQEPDLNILEAFAHPVRRQPHAPAFVTPDRVVSYLEADERIRRMAGALRALGLGVGDRVALRLPNSPSFVLAILALARLGAVAVPVPRHRPAEQLAPTVQGLGIAWTLGLGEPDALPETRLVAVDDALLEPVSDAERTLAHAPGADALALITLSSGTTGQAKAMGRSHHRIWRQWEQQQRIRPHGPGVRMAVMMGLDTNYAVMTCLRMLLSGATVVLPADAGMASLADAVDRLGANHVLMSPAIVGRLMAQLPRDRQRFPGLQTFRLAGSLVQPTLLLQLRRRICDNVCSDYGASEVGALADGDREAIDRLPGSVGYLMPWVVGEACDDQGRALPAGTSGRLRFRGEGFPESYLDDPEASAKVFVDGWFYPGDTGRIHADGAVVLEARSDEIINVGGTKVRPDEVEQVLLQDENIVEAAAYGAQTEGGRTLLLAALVCRGPVDEQQTLQRCRALLGQRAPARLIKLERLPRNEAGKVLRRELAARTKIRTAEPEAQPGE